MEQFLEPLVLMVAIFAIFYFLIIRPQQNRARQTREMQESIKQNDTVLLHGGFEGKVRHVEDDSVIVEVGIDNKVDLKFSKEYIVANVSEAERAAAEKKKAEDEKAKAKDKK